MSVKLRTLVATAALTLGFAVGSAQAALVVSSVVGGAATGSNKSNFDACALGAGGCVDGGATLSFTGDGQVVNGNQSGLYAAPFLSGGNGLGFGAQPNGADTTNYLSTGIGTFTLTFSGLQNYLGLLWGSVDNYNSLEFYNGATLVGTITGLDVDAAASGDQGANGTFYVNIDSTDDSTAFDRVIAKSSQYAFEVDNVAYSATRQVPEPASLALLGMGLLGLGMVRRRKA